MSTMSRRFSRSARLIGVGVVVLSGVASRAGAQDSPQIAREALPRAARIVAAVEPAVEAVAPAIAAAAVAPDAIARWYAPGAQQVPQDVRVMQTIVSTALSAVAPPPLPKALAGDSTSDITDLYAPPRGPSLFGGGDVSGFYMKGYGYLFTVRWPVGRGISFLGARLATLAASMAGQRAALEGEKAALEGQQAALASTMRELAKKEASAGQDSAKREMESLQRAQAELQRELGRPTRAERLQSERARSKALSAWTAEYRQRLSDALRDAIAGYGSTLRRAGPGESITFIADFGGGDSASVIMTAKADALHGSSVAANRSAIQVANGQSGMSDHLRTQLEIMSRIIDTALQPRSSGLFSMTDDQPVYLGGEAEPEYVPGYGVIFRKNARLNTALTVARYSFWHGTEQAAVDSAQRAARKTYQQHLDTLKRETAEVLATYGPTLTGLQDGDWVGIYYDVGSAASLVSGGMEHYLVQARMRDIRQASTQSDPAAWLEQRLVTNERKE